MLGVGNDTVYTRCFFTKKDVLFVNFLTDNSVLYAIMCKESVANCYLGSKTGFLG